MNAILVAHDDEKNSYLVADPINRYTLGDRSNLEFADRRSLCNDTQPLRAFGRVHRDRVEGTKRAARVSSPR